MKNEFKKWNEIIKVVEEMIIEHKKGDIVNIFRNPYKSEDFEGKAELIKSIKQSSYLKKLGFQIWTVKMLNIETSKEFKTKRIIEVLVKEWAVIVSS